VIAAVPQKGREVQDFKLEKCANHRFLSCFADTSRAVG